MAWRVGRGIALLFHDHGTRRGWVWSAARFGRALPPGKTRYPLYRRLGGPRGRSGRAENPAPPGFDPGPSSLELSRYTDWATRPISAFITYTYCACTCGNNKDTLQRLWIYALRRHIPISLYLFLWGNQSVIARRLQERIAQIKWDRIVWKYGRVHVGWVCTDGPFLSACYIRCSGAGILTQSFFVSEFWLISKTYNETSRVYNIGTGLCRVHSVVCISGEMCQKLHIRAEWQLSSVTYLF